MKLRSWRGSTPLSTSTRRSFPWARVLLFLAIIAIGTYLIAPAYLYVRADGLVQGNLVPITPLYRVRIDRLLVNCSDRVKAGQSVAIVSNFIVQADYERQYQQAAAQLELSRVALDEGVGQAETNAAMLHEKYLASEHDAQRLAETFRAYDTGFRGGAISRVDWNSKRSEWKSAEASARSDYEAWTNAKQQIQRIKSDQTQKYTKDLQLSQLARSMANRTGEESLVAPVGGYIVNCVDRPQNVVEPTTPIFTIFQPERAYVLAYFDPVATQRIHINQKADIEVPGLTQKLSGHVGAIYPNLTKLPGELTRYFWQHEQWTEYRPVRIVLDRVPTADRAEIYYGAQARIQMRND